MSEVRSDVRAYAGFWVRFVALMIDNLILIIPAFLFPVFGLMIATFIYKPLFESSPLRGTPGKAVMGLSVVSEDGSTLTLKQAYARLIMSSLTSVVLGHLFIFFTKRKQCLHDLFAGSIVIKEVTLVDRGYFDIWWDQVQKIFKMDSKDQRPMTSVELNRKLKELQEFKEQGLINAEDYEAKKSELLQKWV